MNRPYDIQAVRSKAIGNLVMLRNSSCHYVAFGHFWTCLTFADAFGCRTTLN